jgi:uncharacterized phage infection (PIP) family protein YhgE
MNKPGIAPTDRREIDDRILRSLERLENQMTAESARSREIAAVVTRLASVVDSLPARIPSGGNGSVGGVEVISEGEQSHRLREVMASLPDLARSQVDALASIDGHMSSLSEKVTAYYLSFNETSNDILDTKKGIEAVRELQTEIQTKHQQAAKALNVLREMFMKAGDENRTLASGHQSAVSGVESSVMDVRTALSRGLQLVQGKVSTAVVFSVMAFVCSAAAALGVFLKK